MKSLSLASLPTLGAQFHKFFPKAKLQQLWREAQPHAYHYQLQPVGLLQALWLAYLGRTSGLRQMVQRHGASLGTANFSSLSPALARPVMLAFVRALFAVLAPLWTAGELALVAVDSMALTLPKTQRHRCRKVNNKTVGGGVIWACLLRAGAGCCPIQVLKIVEGAWSDAKQMRALALLPRGPLYLMDRGFYALGLLQQWLEEGVHFIVRVKVGSRLVYEPLCALSAPRRLGPLTLEWDGVAVLGGAQAKAHPRVRLVVARRHNGEPLILASDQWLWSAERLLEAYRQRWQIERFHKLLKEALGLAHLYSFSQSGLAVQIYSALLLAMLIFLAQAPAGEPAAVVIVLLREGLRALRARLGLGTLWRRNSCIRPRSSKRRARAKQQNL